MLGRLHLDRPRPAVTALLTAGATLSLLLVLLTITAVAQAETPADFVDWTAVTADGADGSVHGASVVLSGPGVAAAPGSTVDGGSTAFAGSSFAPALDHSDTIRFTATPGATYTLHFAQPAQDPVLHLGALASPLHFAPETPMLKVSGDAEFDVHEGVAAGAPGGDEANGTVRVRGRYSSLTFTSAASTPDEILLQVGVVPTPTPGDFADWTSLGGNVASGTLHGTAVTFTGTTVSPMPTSRIDGSATVFAGPAFTPALPTSDAIHFISSDTYAYTLSFGEPVTDPLLHVDSIASQLRFPAGTVMSRVSGSPEFVVDDGAVTGAPDPDASGTVQLFGTFTSIHFTTSYEGLDGINLQVADVVPPPPTPPLDAVPPTSTVDVQSATNAPRLADGSYDGPVVVRGSGTDPDPAGGAVETRCSLDPLTAPGGFDDLLTKCEILTTAPGPHVMYAASRDAAGNREDPPVHAAFTIAGPPETEITGGPTGDTWQAGPDFTYRSTIPGSTFHCHMDGARHFCGPDGYGSPALPPGEHVFDIAAVSPGGVEDPTPAQRRFTVRTSESVQKSCAFHPVPLGLRYWPEFACRFDTPEHCADVSQSADNTCVAVPSRCPAAATCTITLTMHWADRDVRDAWSQSGWVAISPDGPTSRPVQWFYGSCPDSNGSCTYRTTTSAVGSGEHFEALCEASIGDWSSYARYGSADDRSMSCDVQIDIRPAEPVRFVPRLGRVVQTYAPAPGTLTVAGAPGGTRAHTTRSADGRTDAVAARAAKKPGILPTRTTVASPGPVTLDLDLNRAATRLLARHRKVRLRVAVTFQPQSGDAIHHTQTITLTPARRPARRHHAKRGRKPALRPGRVSRR